MSDSSGPDALDRYLNLHWDEPRGRQIVAAPGELARMDLEFLDLALADPRVLAGRDGVRPSAPADRLRLMLRFALWLRLAPPHLLPAEFASRAARFRFLVWTLCPRLGWPDELKVGTVSFLAPSEPTDREVSRRMVLEEARAARTDWLGYLENREADSWLATRQATNPDLIEADLRWVTSTWVRSRWGCGEKRLELLPGEAAGRADHLAIAQLVVEQHWISRGAVFAATRAFFPGRWWRWLVPLAGPLAAVAPVVLLVGRGDAARWLAAALGAAAVLVAALVQSPYVALGLARVPAAVTVGEAVLLSLTPRWWLADHGWMVGVGLLVPALGYLAYDSQAYGSRPPRAALRGAGLLAVGVLYAFSISIAVFGFVAPAVGERGECLDRWWTVGAFEHRHPTPECARKLDLPKGAELPATAGVLMLMAGWSLAVGLAAQILWDDRPVSAPLGRVRRVRGAG